MNMVITNEKMSVLQKRTTGKCQEVRVRQRAVNVVDCIFSNELLLRIKGVGAAVELSVP